MLSAAVDYIQNHLSFAISALVSYGILTALVFFLDDYTYATQPKYYKRLADLWYPISDFTAANVNRAVMDRLTRIDRMIFGPRVISLRSIAIQIACAFLLHRWFFGPTIDNSKALNFSTTVAFFFILAGVPFVVTMTIVRGCLAYSARRMAPSATAAATATLFLYVFLVALWLLFAFGLGFIGCMLLTEKYHLTDFEIIDVYALFQGLSEIFVVSTLAVTLIPLYLLLAAAGFILILVFFIGYFRGTIDREVKADNAKIWSFAFRTMWVAGTVILGILLLCVTWFVGTYDMMVRDIPTGLGIDAATRYIQSYPQPERRDAASRVTHFVKVVQSLPQTRMLDDAKTGIYVVARLATGDLTTKPDPVKQFFDQINSCWMSRNISQLTEMIDDRLAKNPSDVWGLYLKACYYTFQESQPKQAALYATEFFDTVDASPASKATKDRAYQLRGNLIEISRSPWKSQYASDDALHNFFGAFPGVEQGRDVWLAIPRAQP